MVIVVMLIIAFCIWMEFFSSGPGEIIKLDVDVFDDEKGMLLALCEMALFPFKQVTWRRCLITSIAIAFFLTIFNEKFRSISSFLLISVVAFVSQYLVHNFILFHSQVAKHLDYVPRLFHELLNKRSFV